MTSRPVTDLAGVFTTLAGIVNDGCSIEEIYAAICVAATVTVPGCDHASLLVGGDGSYRTGAATDDVARMIDQLEQALRLGPCVDAIAVDAGRPLVADLTGCERWPALVERVVAETAVRGAMGVRLRVDRDNVAALNLFSDTPGSFGRRSLQRATVLAAFGTVATNAVALGEDAAGLRRALASNREIGKAVGMLMMLDDVSGDDAFDTLRRSSQGSNVKLVDVAAEVVRRHRPPSDGSPQQPQRRVDG